MSNSSSLTSPESSSASLAKIFTNTPNTIDASPAVIRNLVRDYLVHSAHVDTLKAFTASMPPDSSDKDTSSPTDKHNKNNISEDEDDNNDNDIDNDDVKMEESDENDTQDIHTSKRTKESSRTLTNSQTKEIIYRKEITELIRSGKIANAVELLNQHFPNVLNSAPPYPPTLSSTAVSLPIRFSSRKSTAINNSSSPRIAQYSSPNPDNKMNNGNRNFNNNNNKHQRQSSTGNASSTPNPTTTTNSSSSASSAYDSSVPFINFLEPIHLSFNLDIQAFIESIRAANPLSSSSEHYNKFCRDNLVHVQTGSQSQTASPAAGTSAGLSAPTSMSETNGNNASASGLTRGFAYESVPSPSSDTSAMSSTSAALLSNSIKYAQTLHHRANAMENQTHRSYYVSEMGQVAALLAYEDPYSSMISDYLLPERLDALADMVNSAILVHAGERPRAMLNTLVKQTSVVWSCLQHFNVQMPKEMTNDKRATYFVKESKLKSHKSNSDRDRSFNRLPEFTLNAFLDEAT